MYIDINYYNIMLSVHLYINNAIDMILFFYGGEVTQC